MSEVSSERAQMERARIEHVNCVLNIASSLYQATCTCGWSSTINYLEYVDLLRAMHAHAVVTFGAYV
jgi:hypothetical protein